MMWGHHRLDQLAILARDKERSPSAMHRSDDPTPAPRHPYTWFNSWEGKDAREWWAVARAALTVDARDEAISIARYLQEADDLTNRFENLPIVQRYRAAVAREQAEAPV